MRILVRFARLDLRQQAILQSILDREAAIRHLLSSPLPIEPPVVVPPDPQHEQGSSK
jgi:hypothetical protein